MNNRLEKVASPSFVLPFLLAAAFVLYAGTFGHGWTYDDFPVIVENPDVKSWAGFLADSYRGRPLRELTFLLDYSLFGLDPAGYRLQNILWHGLNAGLLFLLALRLGLGRGGAWIAATLFLVHPLQVEVVANISHRKDSLALAFALMSVLAYREAFASGRIRRRWLTGAVLAAAAAFTAKETAIVLPAVWIAWEIAFLPRERRLLARPASAVFLAPAAAAAAWLALPGGAGDFTRKMVGILAMKANHFGPPDVALYARTVLKSWSFMASKLLLPLDLAVEYTFDVPASWGDPWVVAGLLLIAAWGGGMFLARRRASILFFGLAWGALFFLPVSNLWPLSYFAADRYLYAPSAGLFLALAALIGCGRPTRLPFLAAGGVIVVVLGVLTWRQSAVWASEESLWTHAHRVSPRSSFALNNVGNIHLLKGDLQGARALYGKSVDVNPWNPTAHYNLGTIAEQVGDRRAALEHYRRFLALDDPMFRVQAAQLRERLTRQYGVRLD